ncbi:hypothetical protein CLCR_01729 [Cladophialophora carrionii]|uniref:Uncharacterized protein n=1 Tax=Cladophialophora carrionii TaxID=86049 RepID=A0A1C1CB64_9EURO|nr:hypothetical protein CLCR_01729 [Cladophialophora carrionii]
MVSNHAHVVSPLEKKSGLILSSCARPELFNVAFTPTSPPSLDILFTLAILLVVWVYASPLPDLAVASLDDMLHKLKMFRGCKKLFETHGGAIIDEPIIRVAEFNKHNIGLSSPASQAFSYLRSTPVDALDLTGH